MQGHKVTQFPSPHELHEVLVTEYTDLKRSKDRPINLTRLSSLSVLYLLPMPEDLFPISKIEIQFARREIYSAASGDLIARITTQVEEEKGEEQDAMTIEEKQRKELTEGILIFLQETIRRQEYGGKDPRHVKGWIYDSGSEFYNILEKYLERNTIKGKIPLRDEERFILLSDVYHYIEQHLSEEEIYTKLLQSKDKILSYYQEKKLLQEEINTLLLQSKQTLLQQIALAMAQIKDRDKVRIAQFKSAALNFERLMEGLKTLEKHYQKETRNRLFKNKKRYKMFEFLNKIIETNNNDEEFAKGLTLFILMYIKSEYSNSLVSPEGGLLNNGTKAYQLTKTLLPVEDLKQIPYEERINWLRTLSVHVATLKRAHNDNIEECQYYLNKIDSYIVELEKKQSQPSALARGISTSVGKATKYSLGYFVAAPALSVMGGLVLGSVTGPLGWLCGAAGTVLMTEVGRMVCNSVLPEAVTCVYSWALEKIGSKIGDATVTLAAGALSSGWGGIKTLLNHPDLKEEKEWMERYINALLTAPDQVISAEEKYHLHMAITPPSELEEEGFCFLLGKKN